MAAEMTRTTRTGNLKEIRKSFGLSQMKFAQKVGVSLLTVQLWEHGVSNPNAENKKRLAEVIKELRTERDDLSEENEEIQS